MPIGAAMSMPLCDRPQRPPKPELTRPVTICTLSAAVPVVSVVRAVGGSAAGGSAGGAASAARAAATARACRSAALTSSETPTTDGSAAGEPADDTSGRVTSGATTEATVASAGSTAVLDTGRGGAAHELLHAELEHVRAVGRDRKCAGQGRLARRGERATGEDGCDDSRSDNGACGRGADDATAATCSRCRRDGRQREP